MQAVPKFSSFRPKPESSPTATSSAAASTAPHRPRHRDHEERQESKARARSPENRGSRSSRQQTAGSSDTTNLFVIDRNGDAEIQRYGSNNKSQIPVYWPTSLARTIGVIEQRENIPKASLLSTLGRSESNALRREGNYVKQETDRGDQIGVDINAGFIALRSSRKRKRRDILGLPTSSAASRITQYGDHSDGPESSEEETSDSDTEATTLQLKNEHARLTALLKRDPGNAQTWLDYIAFQDEWMKYGTATESGSVAEAEMRGIADVKLSIYSKALNQTPERDIAREQLLLGMLREAELVIEHVKMLEKWQQTVDSHARFSNLTLEYMNFNQSSFASFRFDLCRDRYARLLRRIRVEGCRSPFLIYFFMRFTQFISDAGYNELAVALWQVILELHCFSPSVLQADGHIPSEFEEFWDNERPRIGETEAPGWRQPAELNPSTTDLDAQAKNHVNNLKEDKFLRWHAAELQTMSEFMMPGRTMDEVETDDPYHVILYSDIRPLLITFPLLSSYPVDLFNAFLCFNKVPTLCDPSADALIGLSALDNFMASVGDVDTCELLPNYNGLTYSSTGRMEHCIYTTDQFFHRKSSNSTSLPLYMQDAARRNFVSHMLRLLVDRYPDWIHLAEYYIAFEYANAKQETAKKQIKRLLKTRPSCLPLYNVYGLLDACSGNDAASNKVFQTAISMSKGLGAQAEEHVALLWRTWIWLAIGAGHYKIAAQRLFSIAGLDYDDLMEGDTVIDQVALNTIDEHLTSFVTIALTSANHISATYAIELAAVRHYLLPSPTAPSITAALSYYRTAFDSLPTSVTANTLALEILHQHRARLISQHIHGSHPYRPRDIRTVIESSIARFPANTIFLTLHRENERRNRIDDRVREHARELLHAPSSISAQRSADDVLRVSTPNADALPLFLVGSITHPNPADNVITHYYAIMTEIQRGALLGSTQHSVRSAFERAAASRMCRNSPALWTTWVAYECSLLPVTSSPFVHASSSDSLVKSDAKGEAKHAKHARRKDNDNEEKTYETSPRQRQRVQQVFFRGLRNLPWVKAYAMLALGPLRECGIMGDEECKAVYDGMLSKGLRVVHELEE